MKQRTSLTVTIYGWDNKIEGVIVWDGTRITTSGSIAVRRCAREPIMPHGIRNEVIKPEEQPEQFMRNLWLMYRSPYFRAVKAAESQ